MKIWILLFIIEIILLFSGAVFFAYKSTDGFQECLGPSNCTSGLSFQEGMLIGSLAIITYLSKLKWLLALLLYNLLVIIMFYRDQKVMTKKANVG